MKYVKCVNNQTYFKDDLADTFEPDLMIGKVYRVAPPISNDQSTMVRIFDGSYGDVGSEVGYLYPRDYFEPLELDSSNAYINNKSITIHLPEPLAGILHAEGIMEEKSVSALVRDWITERLDLPESF